MFGEKLSPLYCIGLNQVVMAVGALAMLSGVQDNRGQRAKFAKDTHKQIHLSQKIYSRSSSLFTFAK